MVKRLKCDGREIDRMDAFRITGKPSPVKDDTFVFTGGTDDDSEIRSAGRHAMFRIDGEDGYYDFERILDLLNAKARDNEWLASLYPWERQIVLDHILRKVTYISAHAR